ncbi:MULTISPECIES: hypothetical protein [unclassified Streptomyces]|uniref:hypothetical protein n=1 Tax=unclassified Streptomyces TaxID=2593676 RepID=UPI0034427FCB
MSWTRPRPSTARSAVALRAALSAVVLEACGLLLAGCSSGSGAVHAAASASASPNAKAMDAYRQRLAQHGVTAAPRPSGSGRPPAAPEGPVPGPTAGVEHPGAPAAGRRPTHSGGKRRRRVRICARSSTGVAVAPAATAAP